MKTNRKGFTLVEIMIVVAIIGILAIIAIPNFIRARRTSQMNACIANMKQIEGAVEQYKLAGLGTPADVAALCVDGGAGAESFLKAEPLCPVNDAGYTLNADGTITCVNNGVDGHDVNAAIGN